MQTVPIAEIFLVWRAHSRRPNRLKNRLKLM